MAEWEKYIRRVEPYVPGEQPKQENVIKLNTNENPYPPSPLVQKAARELNADQLRLYPDPAASELVQHIADFHGISPSRVFPGVGSDDVLGMAFLTFFNGEKPVLFPDISYSFYPVWASMMRIPFETVPLDPEFRIRPADYDRPCGGIVFPNPNAPTGMALSRECVQEIIAQHPDVMVIVDEAYIDFADPGYSVMDLTEKYDNLLVTRTFSKSRSLAGLRIGYAVGSEKVIGYLNDVKYSYNSYTMNTPSILLGSKSLEDKAYFEETTEKVRRTRIRFSGELEKLGFRVLPSQANFVFASHPRVPAEKIFADAKQAGIFFRYFPTGRIRNFLRITIGTDPDMDRVVRFLEQELKQELKQG